MKDFWNLPQLAASSVPLVNNSEQLKNFGENLKKFLDPFGIDVSYYVDSVIPKGGDADVTGQGAKQKEGGAKKQDEEEEAKREESLMDEDIEEVVVSKPLNSPDESIVGCL